MSEQSSYTSRVPSRTERHRIRGIDYCINEWGDPAAPLLVWLHGWGDAGVTLQFVVDELKDDWFVVAPDWRGFGRTSQPAAAYWFPDYLADLDQLLNVYSPNRPVRLAGHSMGANVGGLYAGIMPQRVVAFVNVEGFGLPDSDPGDAPRQYRDWIEKGREVAPFAAFENLAALAAHIRKRNPAMSAAQAHFVARAWSTDTAGGIGLHADPSHKLPNPVLYRRAEAEACWRSVTAPVLLVAGADSRIVELLGAELAESGLQLPFPQCTTRVIDGAGHMLHFEAPGELARAMESFLADTL